MDVTVPSHVGKKRRQGILIHRSTTLDAAVVTRRQGIPVTTVARTVEDLRRSVSPAVLRKAIRAAEVRGYLVEWPTDGTWSELERDFLREANRRRLPKPKVNFPVGPFVADFAWPAPQVIVETDGWRYHRGRQAFEDDHERHLELRRMGWDVIRVTHRQLRTNPDRVMSTIRRLLEQKAPLRGDQAA